MVDGEVTEVNELLADEPNAVNTDAEGKGWLMKVKLNDQKQMDDLLSADDYEQISWSKQGSSEMSGLEKANCTNPKNFAADSKNATQKWKQDWRNLWFKTANSFELFCQYFHGL